MPEKPNKLMPALFGGIITGVLSGIPFVNFVNCLCCAGVLLGGFMAVFFYNKDLTPQMPQLTSSDGLQLGALSGVFGAIVGTIISALLLAVVGNVAGQAMFDMVYNFYDSAGILDQMPPDAIDQMEQGMKDSGLSVFNVIISLIIYPIFGLLGGLIGYSVYKPKAGTPPPAPVVTP
ncbi:MAG: hypothetical protein H6Q29_432 [Bacteroidetes bacterium]|jgi:hypothetical protein|nr:hypothetical protein [Bacteroidota bacterium]